MTPKKRRLNKVAIKQVLKRGKGFNGRNISLKYLQAPGQNSAFSFIVPKKIVKNNVERNKIKRRGRAAIFSILGKIKEGFLIVIFFKKGSELLKLTDIISEIKEGFKKNKILNY